MEGSHELPMSTTVIGIDDRKSKIGFHVDHMTSVYFTDWSVNYNGFYYIGMYRSHKRQTYTSVRY